MFLFFFETTVVRKLLIFFFDYDNINVFAFSEIQSVQNTRTNNDRVVIIKTKLDKFIFYFHSVGE